MATRVKTPDTMNEILAGLLPKLSRVVAMVPM